MQIRALTAEDASSYRELRLASLRDHPTAYCTDFSEEAALPLAEIDKRLASTDTATTYGAFDDDQLVGIATLLLAARLRQRFRATIVGMYVTPSHRRCGIARQLLSALVAQACMMPDIEEVCLCITVGNDSARRAYVSFGFRPEFIEPRDFKYQGQYYDLEWMRLAVR